MDGQVAELTPPAAAAALSPAMLSEEACRQYILQKLFPLGFHCPTCKADLQTVQQRDSFIGDRRCKCRKCDTWFTNRTKTLLEGSSLDWQTAYLILSMAGFDLCRHQIASSTGLHLDTVSRWLKKFSGVGHA